MVKCGARGENVRILACGEIGRETDWVFGRMNMGDIISRQGCDVLPRRDGLVM